jgi:hypothetical protein
MKNFTFVATVGGGLSDYKVAMLADENGQPLPGQCAIDIGEADRGVRKVHVIFEIPESVVIPEGCATSINFK